MNVSLHLAGWLVGIAKAETQTTDAERQLLASHADNARRAVEIGVWHGVTTALLRSRIMPDGVLWAVDPFPVGRLGFSAQRIIARREVARAGGGTVLWVRSTGVDAAAAYAARGEPPACFVFIDGDHAYDVTVADWRAWSPLVRRGGVVCLHDSRSTPARPLDGAGSVRAMQDVVLEDPAFTVADAADSLTVLRRTS